MGIFLYGPLRAWGKGFGLSIFDVRHTLVAGDMMVSFKSAIFLRIKVAPRIVDNYSSLTETILCQGLFILCENHIRQRILTEPADQLRRTKR